MRTAKKNKIIPPGENRISLEIFFIAFPPTFSIF